MAKEKFLKYFCYYDMPIRVNVVQRCDARNDDSSTTDDYKKKIKPAFLFQREALQSLFFLLVAVE
jgi:hypothetical protein